MTDETGAKRRRNELKPSICRRSEHIMNAQQLKYVIEAWKCGSISKAAGKLYITQPNLSRTIRSIEDEYNITIFARGASGIEVTPEGYAFLTEAEKLAGQWESFEERFRSRAEKGLGFRIAVPRASYLSHAFITTVNALDDVKPFEITYYETNNADIINCVSRLGYDLGILRFPVEFESTYKKELAEQQLTFRSIYTFSYTVIMSSTHPMAGRKQIRLSELVPYIALVHGDNHSVRFSDNETDQLYKIRQFSSRITIYDRGIQFEFLKTIPGTFMLVSPMPEEILKAYDLVQIKLDRDDVGMFEDMLIMQKNHIFSAFEKDLLNNIFAEQKRDKALLL